MDAILVDPESGEWPLAEGDRYIGYTWLRPLHMVTSVTHGYIDYTWLHRSHMAASVTHGYMAPGEGPLAAG